MKREKKKRKNPIFSKVIRHKLCWGGDIPHSSISSGKERTEVNLRIWKSYPKEIVKMFSDLRQRAKHMPKECFLGLYSFTVSAEADATKIQGAAETVV